MEPEEPHPRTDEEIALLFPDRGPRPPDLVIVNPDAEPSPNIGHPK